METISCSIIKDLLPLYADGLLSTESAQIVQAHLSTCPDCCQEYEALVKTLHLPTAVNIQAESAHTIKNFQKRQQRQKHQAIFATALVVTLAIFSACFAYIHVGKVHDYLSPETPIVLRSNQTSIWQPLAIGESGYLNFNRLFYNKAVIVDANSDAPVTLRIRDKSGAIVIEPHTIQPGERISLDTLQKGTDYRVEIKTDANFLFIRFV